MKKFKEWVYLLFRPKWERRLYKLLKNASLDKNLSLDTILYDYCLPEDKEGKFFKGGVDAMFTGWLGCFNAKFSSRKLYVLQAQNVIFGLEALPDGSAPEIATHEGVVCNSSLKEYLKQIAHYVQYDEVSDADCLFLKELSDNRYLGLFATWKNGRK